MTLAGADRLIALPAVTVGSGALLAMSADQSIGNLAGTGNVGLGTFTLTTGTLGNSTFSGVIGGTGRLIKQGASTFTLAGGNTYSGNTSVQAGTLATAGANVLPDGSALAVATGATLTLAGDDTVASLALAGTLNGSGTLTAATYAINSGTASANLGAGALTSTSTSTLAGTSAASTVGVTSGTLTLASANRLADTAAVSVASGATLALTGNDTVGSLALDGTITGSGTLTAGSYALNNGVANLDLGTGALSSSGATFINNRSAAGSLNVTAGTLTLGAADRFSAAPISTVASGATLALGGNETLGSLGGAGTVALAGNRLSTGIGGNSTFSGVLNGSGGVTKQGGSSFTLSGTNSYTGTTQVDGGLLTVSGTLASATHNVNAGTLALAAADRLADTAAVNVASGATMTLAGNDTVGTFTLAGTLGGSGTLTAATYAVNGGSAVANLGAGALSSTGASTLAGTAAASTVAVNGGTLTLAAADRLADASSVTVASGALLALTGNDTVGSLTLAGTLGGTGTLTAATYGVNGGSVIAHLGAGALSSTGASTLTGTAAANTVGVTSGTLTLASANRLTGPSAVNVATGATLALLGDQTIGSLTGSGAVGLAGFTLNTGTGGDTSFGGVMGGSGNLVKQGTSTFTLSGANSYTGSTTVQAGVLQVGDGATNGSLASSAFSVAGTLRSARSDNVSLAAPVSGTGILEQAGTGRLTLSGGNKTYSGRTLVTRGELRTAGNEDLPNGSAVTVAAAGLLSLGGNETVLSIDADGPVALAGNLTATDDLLLRGPVTVPGGQAVALDARRIDAVSDGNLWGSSVAIAARDRITLSSGKAGSELRDLVLGVTTVANGGRVDAGVITLGAQATINGGTLELVSSAAALPTLPGADLTSKKSLSLLISIASEAVKQAPASVISVASGAGLRVQATRGGSVTLATDNNNFQGTVEVLSGPAFGTGWSNNPTTASFGGGLPVSYALQGRVKVSGGTVNVGGNGIESDLVYMVADRLATVGTTSRIVARMPFDNTQGTTVSVPGLVLELTAASFLQTDPFGAKGGEIRIDVGNQALGNRVLPLNAGYVTVLPRGGASGVTSVLLTGPTVSGGGYRFFFDGAGVQTEVPVYYNGLLPVTPAVENSISATVAVSEGARKDRFEEAIRTENVALRLRAGVIAEVGPGRPATQGGEGVRGPQPCPPAANALSCQAAPQ